MVRLIASAVLGGLVRTDMSLAKLGVEAALVRLNEGLKRSFEGKKLLAPFGRFEKRTGSTFSKSSVSATSAAFLLTAPLFAAAGQD